MSKKILKTAAYFLIAGIFSVALSGCTKKTAVDPNANKIVIWGFDEQDVWKPVIRNFGANHKGYNVVYQKQTLDSNYENRVLNSILSGQGPDVWAMPNDWVYRHKDQLYPMPSTMAQSYNLDTMFIPSIKQSVYFDQKVYALSPTAEPLMVFYNQKMFTDEIKKLNSGNIDRTVAANMTQLLTQMPKTWTNFLTLSNLLTEKNGANITRSGVALGTSKITNSADILSLMMMQNETDILSKSYDLATFNLPKTTSTGENDTPGKRALDFYTSFADPSSPNYSWNDSLGKDDVDAFVNGKTAMVIGYSSLGYYLNQKYPNFQYAKAFIPQIQQDSTKIVDFDRFTAFGVNKLSKNPAATWSIIGTLVGQAAHEYGSAVNLYTSAKPQETKFKIADRIGPNPEKVSLVSANSLVKGRYPIEFDNLIKDAIDRVNSKKESSQIALDLAANQVTELLRKNSW